MKVQNLIRDFELQKMKESESVKEYSDRLLSIANKVRLLGSMLNDSRIVEKLLVTVLEKFEATITTLENTKDLSKIFLIELLNALQTQEPEVKHDKLDKKAKAGIFVGYNIISKAYRVFQPHTSCVILRRDVHFAENEQWN
ncbi:uncharacterized protein LOC111460172 [Cucurbita moschata]|uniref:Uncharacterized protein LOC111460172 n=1 Tax=Cucurbita moschata TaxID=3662 RepID=A0A6J1H6Y2_CUCMO|nr:uncharacterized protein LOC111460172 [Cucurbita moschata]